MVKGKGEAKTSKNNLNKKVNHEIKNNKAKKVKGYNSADKKVEHQTLVKFIRIFLIAAIFFIVFYPPFVRGLYFENEQLPTEIFVMITFAVYWVYKFLKRDRAFLKTPLEWVALGFVAIYLVSIFVALGTRLAIAEWLKYCMYFAVFLMITDLFKDFRSRIKMLWVMLISAVCVCFLGIDGSAGAGIANGFNAVFNTFGIQIRFFDLFAVGRIFSTLQYPDTLAVYLIAMFFVSMGLAMVTMDRWKKSLINSVNFIMILTLILTKSRGGILIFTAIFIFYIFILPKGFKIKGLYNAIIPGIIALAAIYPGRLTKFMTGESGNGFKIWIVVFAGIILTGAISLYFEKVLLFLQKLNWKVYSMAAGAIIVICVGSFIVITKSSVPLELSHSISESESVKSVEKIASVKPGHNYKLVLDVNASANGDKKIPYQIDIMSVNDKSVLTGISKTITSFSGKSTNGNQKVQIDFKTPEDCDAVNIKFINTYKDTKALFDNAGIVEADANKLVTNITLNNKYLGQKFTGIYEKLRYDMSVATRVMYYKDAIKILDDYWIKGAGGGAWTLLYHAHQAFNYSANQVHCFYLQLWIEAGILGILAVLAMIIILIYMVISLYRRDREDKNLFVLQITLFTAIIAMLAHSAIDFDFSLGAVYLLFWELAALFNIPFRLSAMNKNLQDNSKSTNQLIRIIPVAGIVITIIITLFPIQFQMARWYSEKSIGELAKNKKVAALEYMEKAKSVDPFMPQYRQNYATILLNQDTVEKSNIDKVLEESKNAVAKGNYNFDILMKVSMIYTQLGKYEDAIQYINRALELYPFFEDAWRQKMSIYAQESATYFGNNKNVKALGCVDKALAVLEEESNVNKRNWKPFSISENAMQMGERLKYVKDNINKQTDITVGKIAFYNYPEVDMNLDGTPDQWSSDNPEDVKFSVTKDGMLVENISKGRNVYIRSRTINTTKGKKYRIMVELGGGEKFNEIQYKLDNVETKTPLKLSGENIYTTEVTITELGGVPASPLYLKISDKLLLRNIQIYEI